jgi:signal transduction histidine kinase
MKSLITSFSLVVLLIVGTYSFSTLNHNNDLANVLNHTYKKEYRPHILINDVLYELKDISFRMTSYIAGISSATYCMHKLEESWNKIDISWEEIKLSYQHSNVSDVLKKDLKKIDKRFQRLEEFLDRLLEAYNSGADNDVINLLQDEWPYIQMKIFNPLMKMAEHIQHINKENQSSRVVDLISNKRNSKLITISSFVLLTLLVLTVRYLRKKALVHEESALNSSKLAQLGEMAASISHEINNPISIITAKIDVLLLLIEKPEVDKEKVTKHLNAILKTLARMTRITRSMRIHSRDHKSESVSKDFSVTNLFDDLSEAFNIKAKDSKVEFEFTNKNITEDRTFYGDEIELGQVFINIANNAIDAASEQEEKWVKLDIEENNNELVATFTDSGKGIPLDIQKKMFENFFTTKEVGMGTGLGMGITKEIIERNQGSLIIDNECENTRLIVKLPFISKEDTKEE